MKKLKSTTSRKVKVNKVKTLYELFRTNLAGVQYSDYQNQYTDNNIHHGSKVQLYWERCNTFDPLAIVVKYHGRKIGYIPGGTQQQILHDYRKIGIRIDCEVVSVNINNPSWCHYVVKCSSIRVVNNDGPDIIML